MVKEVDIPEGFQQTEIGIIPIDWNISKMDEIGIFFKGKGIRKDQVSDEGFPCIRYGEIYTTHNEYIKSFASYVKNAVAKESIQIKKGDILFAGSGETKEEIGKCVAFITDEDAYAGGDIVILRPSIDCSSLYLGFLLNNRIISTQKSRFGQGDAIVHISANNLSEIFVPLPLKQEQTAIASALSDIDALIETLEKLISKKRSIKHGAMQELLTGKRRLAGFVDEWEVKKLGNYVRFQVGFPFSSLYFNQEEVGIRLIKNRDLKSDDQVFYYKGEYPKEFLVYNGDILVGMDGDFLLCNWTKGVALLNQRVGRLVKHGIVNLNFLYFYLQKYLVAIQEKTSSTTVKHLSHGDVENITLPLPICEEQDAIANIFCDMDSEIEALEQKLQKYSVIKQGMMQVLLTGKIRLI